MLVILRTFIVSSQSQSAKTAFDFSTLTWLCRCNEIVTVFCPFLIFFLEMAWETVKSSDKLLKKNYMYFYD